MQNYYWKYYEEFYLEKVSLEYIYFCLEAFITNKQSESLRQNK